MWLQVWVSLVSFEAPPLIFQNSEYIVTASCPFILYYLHLIFVFYILSQESLSVTNTPLKTRCISLKFSLRSTLRSVLKFRWCHEKLSTLIAWQYNSIICDSDTDEINIYLIVDNIYWSSLLCSSLLSHDCHLDILWRKLQ